MTAQPTWKELDNPIVKAAAAACGVFGSLMVGGAYLRLKITGTYLGDYFGILMKERVQGFPFNVMNNPMYMGSTILFLAHALWLASPAGLVLTLLQLVVYRAAILFEEYE
jgi:methylene-fatty-acyl-phospholipid synthase